MKMRKNGYRLATIMTLASASFFGSTVQACSGSEPYIGTICMTAATFCPKGYAEANGALLDINNNISLFSLIGKTYGGDGRTTFGLPNMQGRTPVGQGRGYGLTNVLQGQMRGKEKQILVINQMPSHSHNFKVAPTNASTTADAGAWLANTTATSSLNKVNVTATNFVPSSDTSTKIELNSGSIGNTGSNAPLNTIPPQLGTRYCIAITGLYPPRN